MPSHIFAKSKMKGRLTKKVCPCCDDLRNTKKLELYSKEYATKVIESQKGDSDLVNDITTQCDYLFDLFKHDNYTVNFNYILQEYIVYLNDYSKYWHLDTIDDALVYASNANIEYKDVDDLLSKYDDFIMSDFEYKELYIKDVIDLDRLANIDYNELREMCYSFCHCITIECDLASYIIIDGHRDCVPILKKDIQDYIDEM